MSTGPVLKIIQLIGKCDLDNENGIPYLCIWTKEYVNLRKIYINLENHREYPHKPHITRN